MVVPGALICMCSISGVAQNPGGGESSASAKSSSTKRPKKPTLNDVTRVSTDQVAQSAAKNVSSKGGGASSSDAADNSVVLEFKPATANDDSAKPVKTKEIQKPTLKKVHGTVYGAAGAGSQPAGAAAGVTSKDGKTSIYIETDRSRASSSQ